MRIMKPTSAKLGRFLSPLTFVLWMLAFGVCCGRTDAGIISFDSIAPGNYTSLGFSDFEIVADVNVSFEIAAADGNQFLVITSGFASNGNIVRLRRKDLGTFAIHSFDTRSPSTEFTNALYGYYTYPLSYPHSIDDTLDGIDDDADGLTDEDFIQRSLTAPDDSFHTNSVNQIVSEVVFWSNSGSFEFRLDNVSVDGNSTFDGPFVPEPSTLSLLGVGACLFVMGAAHRRRNRKKTKKDKVKKWRI